MRAAVPPIAVNAFQSVYLGPSKTRLALRKTRHSIIGSSQTGISLEVRFEKRMDKIHLSRSRYAANPQPSSSQDA
jgi:hypothetical protein